MKPKKKDKIKEMMLRVEGVTGVQLTKFCGYDKGWASVGYMLAKEHNLAFKTKKEGRIVRYFLRIKQ